MHLLPEFVWQWQGVNPGPHVMVLGGVHGNEVTGVMLVEELRQALDTGMIAPLAGKITLALGNPRAIQANTRGSESHSDLNRVFTEKHLSDTGDASYETRRARELAPILSSVDYLIDLHATNKPSEAFVVIAHDTARHRELSRFFACNKVLHVPDTIISGSTIEFVDRNCATGLCYESGWVGDLDVGGTMRRSVEAILRQAGLLAPEAAPATQNIQQLFILTYAITLTEDGFTFAKNRGLYSFEPFAPGDLLGFHGSTQLTAPYKGVMMFPKVSELWRVGSPVAFLAREGTS